MDPLEIGEGNSQLNKEPKPLSAELEIDPKKKPQDKKAIVNFRDKNYIKNIVDTPKEAPSNNDTTGGGVGSDNSSDDVIAQARARMNSEPKEPISLSGNSSSGDLNDGEVITEEDGKFYAELLVEGLELLAVWVFTWWGKDADEDKYKPSPKSKTKLIYLLGKMLTRAGKKHPVELYFFATLILMYVPAFRAAQENRKKVLSEKAAQALLNEEAASKRESESGGSGNKRRRSLKNDSDISDAKLEDE